MGKNQDLAIILIIVIIGMFIPFFGSILIMNNLNNLDITTISSWLKIGKTFGWFLLIFGLELGVVYLYFTITNTLAQKKIDEQSLPGKNK